MPRIRLPQSLLWRTQLLQILQNNYKSGGINAMRMNLGQCATVLSAPLNFFDASVGGKDSYASV
jgi:hypothetical protein